MRLARVGPGERRGIPGRRRRGLARSGRPLATDAADHGGRAAGRLRDAGDLQVVDVRRPGEYAAGHVPGAVHVPLDRLRGRARASTPAADGGDLRGRLPVERGRAACSRRTAFADLVNVIGGTSAWVAAGYEVDTAYVIPSKSHRG